MTPTEIGIAGIILAISIILLGIPVAFGLIMVGFVGIAMIIGTEPALSCVALIAFNWVNSYEFAVVPLFLLMSAFISYSGIAKEAFEVARAWVGQLKGGLAMATTVASGLFAACCGSSLATTIAMGRMTYSEMKFYKYDARLLLGTIAAGGTLGILIPPSIGFIIIGILTELSIGKLFIAGIIPGILEILFYLITIYIICKFNPKLGPALPKTTLGKKIGSLGMTWPVTLLFIVVIGGIYGGIFTPTEAGGIGAFGGLVVSLARRQLTSFSFIQSLMEAAKMSAIMVALIIGAFVFNQFLALTRIPFVASEYIVSLGLSKYTILLLLLAAYILLGMVFDIFAILVLTIPIIYPTIMALGFDPIWYSVIMVRVVEVGLISPPFGVNLFGLAGTVDVPLGTIYRGVTPFLIADILNLALLIAVPSLATFLPEILVSK